MTLDPFGRYFDWTKYELARGSFGGDMWTTFQDRRVPSFGDDSIDPGIKPMSQDVYNAGFE